MGIVDWLRSRCRAPLICVPLPVAPSIHNAGEIADLVRDTALLSGRKLDYSRRSLWIARDLVEHVRVSKLEEKLKVHTGYAIGCYFGEVMVRNDGARWVEAGIDDVAFPHYPLVQLGQLQLNVLGWQAKYMHDPNGHDPIDKYRLACEMAKLPPEQFERDGSRPGPTIIYKSPPYTDE